MSIHYPDNTSLRPAITSSGISNDSSLILDVNYGSAEKALSLLEFRKNLKFFTVAACTDMAALSVADSNIIECLGRTTLGDGGGGTFYYDGDSAATVDDGIVFAGPGGVGRFIRLWSDHVNILWFGICNNGSTDAAPLLRKAMVHGDVFFPGGNYNFNTYVNLKANRRYFGAGPRSVLRRAGVLTSIFAIANYDIEAYAEGTFVEAKENIEISDLTFDWYLQSGWVNFAALILIKGSNTGNDDRLENLAIRGCKFIDSYSVPHSGSDAWAINYASSAPVQEKLFIENNKCEAEGHQFCAGGADGWNHVRIKNNYIYHPRANAITMSTLVADAVWGDIEISNNEIVGPYSLGIWVGPDYIGATGYQVYRDIKIINNKIIFDSYSDGGTIAGIYINVYEGLTDDVHVSDNQITYGADYANGSAAHSIFLVNNGERSATVNSNYTQPAIAGTVNIVLVSASGFAANSLISVSGGGTYQINSVSGNTLACTRLPFYNAAITGATISASGTLSSLGTLSSVFITGNKCGAGRISLSGTTRAVVSSNHTKMVSLATTNRDLSIIANDLERLSNTSHNTGIVQGNRFVQFDDSGGYGSIAITPGSYNGFTNEDSIIYVGNVVVGDGSNAAQLTKFIYESSQGVFSGRYYGNIGKGTSSRSIDLAHSYVTFTADSGMDTLTSAAHGLYNGQLVKINTDGTIPAGLSISTTYYVVERAANTLKVSATREGSPIDITSNGSGTHYITPVRNNAWNVFEDCAIAAYPASISNVRYFSASLDFDLTSVSTQTITVTTPGVSTNSIILMSVPSNAATDGAHFSVQISNYGVIRVTCARTDSAVGVNPGSGTFQFMVMDPR